MFSPRYLAWALDVMGTDRVLFSTDHPYVPLPDGGARPHRTRLRGPGSRRMYVEGNLRPIILASFEIASGGK